MRPQPWVTPFAPSSGYGSPTAKSESFSDALSGRQPVHPGAFAIRSNAIDMRVELFEARSRHREQNKLKATICSDASAYWA